MNSLIAISTNPADLAAFVIGLFAIVGLLALARYLPEVWIGDKTCDCPQRRKTDIHHRSKRHCH